MALTTTQVSELYVSIFNRVSEKSGSENWIANGGSAASIADTMLATQDAKDYFGTSLDSDAAFVEHIYNTTLNKGGASVDAAGKQNWVDYLADTTHTRGGMVDLLVKAVADYEVGGSKYDTADQATKDAAQQFVNRVAVSDDAATTIASVDTSATKTYATTLAFGTGGLNVTSDTATVATAKAAVATEATAQATLVETAAVAAYDAALVTYNAAVVTATASKAAADAAAADVVSVANATASKTAATTADTDAKAVVTAAAAVTTAAAATPSVIDDSTASTNAAAAATAATATAAALTTATTAVTTAQAAADAANAVGDTAALTTATETVFGTAKSDTYTATAGNGSATKTYNSADTIVDSSSIDNDTLTITATDDVTATATVIGIENVNFNLDAASTPAGTDTVFNIAATNIAAGTITATVTKAATTVTATSITGLKDAMTVNTDLATATLAGVANANLKLNMTATTATTITDISGTTDDATVTAAGNLTVTDINAEENVTITGQGSVTISDLTSATTTLNNLTVNAAKAITIADSQNGGNMTLTSDSGNVTITDGTGLSDQTGGSDVTITAKAGNIVTTVSGLDNVTGTMTFTASGDISNTDTTDDGDITVYADAAKTAVFTATGAITATEIGAATTATFNFGQASTLENSAAAITTLNLSSTNASAATADKVLTVTTGGTGLNAVDNINFTGSNDVTLAWDGTDLVAAAAASTAGSTTAAAVIATDNSTATSRIEIQEATGSAADLSKLAVDQIAITVDQGADILTVASGANIYVAADQTNLKLTAAAVAGNVVNLFVEDDSTAVDTNSWDMTALTTTNIATVNLALNDTEEAILGTTLNVGTTNDLVVTGAGDFTVGTSVTAKTFNASAATGIMSIKLVNTIDTIIKTGSGNDIFTTDGTANDYNIDGGDGVDTLVVANGEDYTSAALALTSIEKIDITAANGSATFAGSLMSGKDYVVFGDAAADILNVTATVTTGETVDMSSIVGSLSTLKLTGAAGGDILTGSSVTGTTIIGGAGADTIVGGAGVDTITGGAGVDTITTGGGADKITIAPNGANDVITDFTVGTSGDVLILSEALIQLDAAGNADTDWINIDLGTSSVANSDAVVLTTITAAADTSTYTTDTDILIANLSTNIADAAALETALETGGALEITMDGASAAKDVFLVAFDDGANSYLAHVETAAGATDGGKYAASDLTATIVATLTGVADVTTLVAANFDITA